MKGVNFVELIGKIVWPSLKTVGDGYKLFKGKIAIPHDDKFQYLKVAAWHNTAESLGELPEHTFVKIHGHIEERSYDGKCKQCGGFEKKYWTEVLIDNFVVVKED